MPGDDVVTKETVTMTLWQPLGVASITHSQLTDERRHQFVYSN